MDIKEAEAYGITLTRSQRSLMDGQTKYALVGQHMPWPNCCDNNRSALHHCTEGCNDSKRILVPTVVQLCPDDMREQAEQLAAERWDRWEKSWLKLDEPPERLPRLVGWAQDMPDIGFGSDCGCSLTGDLGCGCNEFPAQFFSPYGAIPVSEDVALAVLQSAHRDLPAGGLYPLLELAELQNHGLEFVDDMDWDHEPTLDEMQERVHEMERRALEYCGIDPDSNHLHIDRRKYSFEIPEQAIEPVEKMIKAERRALLAYKDVFANTPRTLRAEADQLFAYPCY